ncbi:MAG: hypothetical protein JNJ43_10540 [Anaerolineales bacterium]|nr:hypothetical protein [Anaerolineales bacterium]
MNKNSLSFLRENGAHIFILCVLLILTIFRISAYGNLRLSIANAETDSYINSSRASIFSWQIFAGKRLFTTNLIYKFANDAENCPITSYGKPGIGQEDERRIQPCFDKIALLQNILSLFGWAFLAYIVAKRLRNFFIKLTSAIVIVLFGFTPQIAEWDSILSPESLSLSMLAITLALTIELAFSLSKSQTPFQTKNEKILLAACVVLFLLWVFVRDVHLYTIPITVGLLALLFFIKNFRWQKPLMITIILLFAFFVIGFLSARDSLRATRYPVINAIDAYIQPYPARVAFFKQFDMPARDDPTYQDWADKNATKAYGLFLITHPGFVATTLWDYLDQLSDNFIQPYFFTDEIKHRETLVTIGQFLHPQTPAMYLLALILVIALIENSIQTRQPDMLAWAWLGIWVFAIGTATLFLSFFGDTAGTRRHIMPSVETLRLFLWIFLMPFLDKALRPNQE